MPRPPNILFICSDQHRADAMSCYGNPICRTPNLDRLAASGVLLERCHSQNPVCCPQRCSIMTGRLSRNHGRLTNGGSLRTDLPTLPSILAAHGYRTAAVGKLHLTSHADAIPATPYYGFQSVTPLEDSRIGPYLDWVLEKFPEQAGYSIGALFNLPTDENFWRGKRDFRKEYLAAREKYVKPLEISATCNWGFGHWSTLPEAAHQNTWLADRAIEQINGGGREQNDKPLFLWLGFVDPHNPFDPPGRFQKMYDPAAMPPPIFRPGEEAGWTPHHHAMRKYFSVFTRRDWQTLKALYYGSVTFMDEQIGRVLDHARRTLDMENTIVVYTADHGEILGDHGICGKSAYHYDPCHHVPMILQWEGRFAAGARRETITELTDIMPTLLDAAGVHTDAALDARSFAPLLMDDGSGYTPRGHAYIESYAGGPEDPTHSPHTWAKTIRTDRWRATFYPDPEIGELYDMHNDPEETHNLWRDPAARPVIEDHRATLMTRMMLTDFPVASLKPR
ncbi:MAG: sulfatase-like hydrolase/transferase [Planctomycetes bacterium]|nr:sulfatase-like hydrolase/transferase [Planctomycetota bacterium]